MLYCFFGFDQNQNRVSGLERGIELNDQERTRLLTEKGRLEQEAEVVFCCMIIECI